MELIHHFFGLRIMILIELHGAPAVLAPVLPVLNQSVDWNFSLAKFGSGIENLLLAVISLSTLQVAVGPLWKQRRFACELTVFGHDAVQLGAVEEVVIDGLPHLGAERRGVLRCPDSQLNACWAAVRGD